MTLTRNTSRFFINYLSRSLSNSILKSPVSTICWKCGKERSSITEVFCEQCNIIQAPPEKHNYFKVFDMEEKFNIDQQQLRTKFRKLQSMLHPDKFSNKTDEEQNISAEYSSLLNKAFNNLQVPLKRAEHLLKLKGEQIGEGQGMDDPKFLMEVMELNEEVENANNDSEKLRKLNAENKFQLDKISQIIDECFKNNDIQAAKQNIIRLKYFNSLSNRINGMLRELGETD